MQQSGEKRFLHRDLRTPRNELAHAPDRSALMPPILQGQGDRPERRLANHVMHRERQRRPLNPLGTEARDRRAQIDDARAGRVHGERAGDLHDPTLEARLGPHQPFSHCGRSLRLLEHVPDPVHDPGDVGQRGPTMRQVLCQRFHQFEFGRASAAAPPGRPRLPAGLRNRGSRRRTRRRCVRVAPGDRTPAFLAPRCPG